MYDLSHHSKTKGRHKELYLINIKMLAIKSDGSNKRVRVLKNKITSDYKLICKILHVYRFLFKYGSGVRVL